jgi:thiol:disulfide interchange protein
MSDRNPDRPADPGPTAAPHPDATHRRPRWRRWMLEGALFVAIVVLVGLWQTRNVPGGDAPGFEAPLAGAPGARIALDEFRARHPGRPVALYFWAEWCAICKLNQGAVDSLAADHPVLTVAMQSGDAAAVARQLSTRGLSWTTAVDDSGRIAAAYGLSGVPAFIVLDARGRIRFAEQGYTSGLGMRGRLWWAAASSGG